MMTTQGSEAVIEQEIKEIKELSLFVLDDDLTDEVVNDTLQKILDDFNCGFESTEENVRALNFISYLNWRKGDKTKAEEFNEKSKKIDATSIVSLHNTIIFHWELDEISQTKELIETVMSIRKEKDTFAHREAFAIAEIAYCFARIGPKCHEKAEYYFRKAIKKLQSIPRKGNQRHYLWDFGLALILRRQANIFAMRDPNRFNPVQKNQEAIDLLERITSMCVDRQIRARAWVELGIIKWSKVCSDMKLRCKGLSVEKCFENAVQLCPDAYFVLQRWGQHLRYLKRYDESKRILEKSLGILDTQFARHHIALTLRTMVIKNDKQFVGAKNHRKECQERTAPHHSHKPSNTPLLKLKVSPASPKKVEYFPSNSKLEEAVEHLEKALKMNDAFDRARYDLGLTYRYLKRHKEAIDCFSRITSTQWSKSTEYKALLICAYEQNGICFLEMAEMDIDEKKKAQLKRNGIDLLWKSLEVATLVIKTVPSFKETIASFPTLKELLTKDGNPDSKQELAALYEFVHDHDKAADLCKQLLEIDNTNSFAIRKVVEEYVRMKDFENAIHTLSLLQCTRQSDALERKFYLSTFLDGAKQSYKIGKTDESKFRFMQAYNLASKDRVCMCDTECTCCDLLLLCVDHIDDYCACKLSTWLQPYISSQLEARVLVNDADCLGGRQTLTYMLKTMENAKYILPIVNKSTAVHREKSTLGCSIQNEILLHKEKLIAITFENAKHSFSRSVLLKGKSCENFDMAALNVGELISEIVIEMSHCSL